MKIGNRIFEIKKHTYVMGILNVTPDSFSDGGKFNRLNLALAHVEQMIAEGADMIDIGGESTRPGHQQITEEEEIRRIAPVVAQVKSRFDIPVSVDTYKAKVARACLEEGAVLVNDIWGLKYDPDMAGLISERKAACCLMHNRNEAAYHNFMEEMKEDLQETLTIARNAGIAEDKIILDPGVGFGKTYENNLEAICRIEELHSLGCPLLLGTSRKSVIGLALDLPVDERVEGTLVTTVQAVLKGCAFVRVHDVKENKRAVRMAEAIRDGWRREQEELS
jgi:dihydropteroate synthase